MDWINIKDGLPKEEGRYLVFELKGEHTHNLSMYSYPYPCCEPNIAYFSSYSQWRWSSMDNDIKCNPTHWMPLPELPKEKSVR